MEAKTPAKPKQSGGGWKKRLVFSAVVSSALTFTLCLFGPLDLFFNNYEELWFHLQDIIGGLAIVAALFFVITTLVGTLLRGKLHAIYMALLFGGLLGTYVQASFMNKDYGLLNGTSVDWSAYTGYGVVNTLVWLVCVLVPLIAMLIWKEKKVRPVFLFLSCALIVMQGASLVVSYINYPTVTESATLTTEGIYDLSKEENTIVFVLDTLDEAYYQQFIDENPEYKEVLSGFTQYTNAMASGARTPVAMPLIMTGIPRTVSGTYADYTEYAWSEQTGLKSLKDAGYDTRVYTESQFISASAQDTLDNLEMSTSSVGNYVGLTKKMYKLTLYKYVPHFLKWRFWMYTGDFDKYLSDKEYVIDDAALYQNYQDNDGFTYTDQEKCFRLYHFFGVHEPYDLTSGGTRKNETTSQRRQMKGVFHIVKDMLEDMKENGVYDNANIFIIADHGDKGKCQYAACLYKPAGSTGAYATSDAPISFADISATFADIAGADPSTAGSGTPLTDVAEGETRTRNYYLNIGTNADFITGEFESDGHASDTDALKLVDQYEVLSGGSVDAYPLGKELSFASDRADANLYCTHGFRTVQTNTTRTEGRYAQMVIPIADPPKSGTLTVRYGLSNHMMHDSHMIITVGGETVFEDDMVTPYHSKEIVFDVPVSALEDGTLTIDFEFTDVPESEEEKDAGTRRQTLKLTTLTITAGEE